MSDLLFEMNSGVSGDMVLSGLFDLGLDFNKWKSQIKKLDLPKTVISKSIVERSGITATSISIKAPETSTHRHLKSIVSIIKKARYPKEVEKNAIKIFTRLAEAEAKVHGCDIETVQFHEVGAVDSIIDIVGACLGFHSLKIKKFFSTSLVFGYGEVDTAHGPLPVPCPATIELSRNFPSRRIEVQSELSTPTGTAIVTTLVNPEDSLGTHRVTNTGYGSGTKVLKNIPNILRLSIVDTEKKSSEPEPDEKIFQVECNLDDLSPELLGFLTTRLFEAGCNDVWQESIFMKKNRAGIKLCALCQSKILKNALLTIAAETSTGGIRYFPVNRIVSRKKNIRIKTKYGNIRIKEMIFSRDMMDISHRAPEFEDCREIAEKKKLPLHIIYSEAQSCINRKFS